LALLALAGERSDGKTYEVTYSYDEAGRPWAALYQASDADPEVIFLVTNDRGDVIELLDEAGDAFAVYRYDAWGNAIAAGTSSRATNAIGASAAGAIALRQPLRYAGYALDEQSGLYYCSQRYYDPATFQFITKDPAKADGEESAYQYCAGDPVGSVDPTGEFAIAVPVIAGGAIALLWAGNLKFKYLDDVARALEKGWRKLSWARKVYTLSSLTILLVWARPIVRPYAGRVWIGNYRWEKDVGGWHVVDEKHSGKPHAHWKKGSKRGSVNKDGTPHHKGESTRPPKKVRDLLKNRRGYKKL
ncbi:MAG: RHS repeat-associated core domain-containing protein, partial [Coriobacteriales bacterium]|nr:RHS repeat-associated core domain-containing protein [Coriobacteriales bacterium]